MKRRDDKRSGVKAYGNEEEQKINTRIRKAVGGRGRRRANRGDDKDEKRSIRSRRSVELG